MREVSSCSGGSAGAKKGDECRERIMSPCVTTDAIEADDVSGAERRYLHPLTGISHMSFRNAIRSSPAFASLLLHRTLPCNMASPRNILTVIGTTGVGKSQYAISLARSPSIQCANIRPTVLSSDSMQLYDGLPVITNKATEEEMEGVEHWGLGCVKPGEGGSWEVGKWCLEAWEKVSEVWPLLNFRCLR